MDTKRILAAGDPFTSAPTDAGEKRDECAFCWDSGYVFLGGLDEDGEEVIYAVACRRCADSR